MKFTKSSGLGKMRSAGATCEESLYRPANITATIKDQQR